MGNYIKRVGRFYSSIIIQNIGLFLFVGIMSVLFMEDGWFPDQQFYDISQLIYRMAIPVVIATNGGRRIGGEPGATAAILAVAGILVAGQETGILGAMILGPAAAYAVDWVLKQILKKVKPGFEMLARNMTIALTGCVFAVVSCLAVQPALFHMNMVVQCAAEMMVNCSMLPFLAVVIEPAKILFMNNGIHHGVLIPLGMEQAKTLGKSVFFLLESNPGPGFGVLLALWLGKRESREKYGLCMLVHFLGGIHEVYFPYILSNLWLLIALVAGGIGGDLCFSLMDAGTAGPVSPGSILTILILSRRAEWLGNCVGIVVSVVISMVVAVVILKVQKMVKNTKMKDEKEHKVGQMEKLEKSGKQTKPGKQANLEQQVKSETLSEELVQPGQSMKALSPAHIMSPQEASLTRVIKSICVVCDAGVGSSAMGAALIRRRLTSEQITGIRVDARPADRIDQEADLYVCQKNFADKLKGQCSEDKLYLVENLLDTSGYDALIQKLHQREEET